MKLKLSSRRAKQVLAFCAEDPVERVFLEDVARRGLGRFTSVADRSGRLTALCHRRRERRSVGRGLRGVRRRRGRGSSRAW